MSRSNPIAASPVVKFYKWKGKVGELAYWDKEQEKEVSVETPFEFLVLDELATISGFSKKDDSSYFSNEVRSVAKEPFVVRTSEGIKQEGLYKDLADVRSKGAKYAKSIYAMAGNELINIRAHGAALTAWIELTNKHQVTRGKVLLTGAEAGKTGDTEYFIPIFEYTSCTEEEDRRAREMDKQLQEYLNTRQQSALFNRDAEEEIAQQETVLEDIDEAPISLDEIPF